MWEFPRLGTTEPVPDHSWLSRTRSRLPPEMHEAIFARVLQHSTDHGLITGGGSEPMPRVLGGFLAAVPAEPDRCRWPRWRPTRRCAPSSRRTSHPACQGDTTTLPVMLLTTAADTLTSILTVATGTEAAMLVVSLEPDLHRTAEPRVRRRTAGVEQPCYRCLAIGQVTFAQYSATEGGRHGNTNADARG